MRVKKMIDYYYYFTKQFLTHVNQYKLNLKCAKQVNLNCICRFYCKKSTFSIRHQQVITGLFKFDYTVQLSIECLSVNIIWCHVIGIYRYQVVIKGENSQTSSRLRRVSTIRCCRKHFYQPIFSYKRTKIPIQLYF